MAGDITCVLTVDRDGGVLLTQGETNYEGKVIHDDRTGLMVARLDRFVNHHPSGATGCEKIDLELLGAVLFDILLGGNATRLPTYRHGEKEKVPTQKLLGDLVAEWVKRVGDDGRFRLSLRFEDEASPFATYPWECLFVGKPNSAQGYFLSQKATLMRLVQPTLNVAPVDHLEILVAWAEPGGGLSELEGPAVFSAIKDALGAKIKSNVKDEPDVTWDRLKDAIVKPDVAPDILHLIAHGKRVGTTMELALCPTEEAKFLEQAKASKTGLPPPPPVAWTSVGELQAVFEDRQKSGKGLPSLVFLHACNSGRADPGVDAFRGAAEVIARAGVPFVVAMQYEIANDDAKQFTEKFYETIADPSASVDDAVRAGRSALGIRAPSWGHRRFATPVIFLRNETSHLLRTSPIAGQQPLLRDDLQPCPDCQVKQVSRHAKYCPCEQKVKFRLCAREHVNAADATECWRADCDAPFKVAVTTTATPSATPPTRAPSRGGLEA